MVDASPDASRKSIFVPPPPSTLTVSPFASGEASTRTTSLPLDAVYVRLRMPEKPTTFPALDRLPMKLPSLPFPISWSDPDGDCCP